jgi:glycerol-3-phosphate dehydrogenase
MGKVYGHWKGKELTGAAPGEGGTIEAGAFTLQKVSREHHIDRGPGGTVLVAGGKYTTFRKMAEEVVDFALKAWHQDAREGRAPILPEGLRAPSTHKPFNPHATPDAVFEARHKAAAEGVRVPAELWERYGADALTVLQIAREHSLPAGFPADPEGFPCLAAQLRYSIRREMSLHLTDFYLRRIPLYASRADHGLPWAEALAHVWADERRLPESAIAAELVHLRDEVAKRSEWMTRC